MAKNVNEATKSAKILPAKISSLNPGGGGGGVILTVIFLKHYRFYSKPTWKLKLSDFSDISISHHVANFQCHIPIGTADNGYNLKPPMSKSHILVGILVKCKYE